MSRRSRRSRRAGFTLMEVLLVLVILVILGSMAGVFIRTAQRNARLDAARAQIGAFESAIKMYELNVQSYPSESEGLQSLRQPSGNVPGWSGPYLDREVPLDPWQNPYQYECDGADYYRIWSMGPDGIDGTDDDISSEY
ncbi:MAG: type II secretion system major pseudopilin GspG [Planctomycetales bacterium]|nr:type II secretion system major pseudopilin GspG [Planctomycetales bacterium]